MAGANAGFGILSAITTANNQASQLEANANAQQYNSELYQQQAKQAMAQGIQDSNLQFKRAMSAIATQRAQTAENLGSFSGTAGDLIDQSAVNAEVDRQNTLYSSLLTAQTLQSQSKQSAYAANVLRNQINPTINSGYMNAVGNVLSSVGSYGGQSSKTSFAGGMF